VTCWGWCVTLGVMTKERGAMWALAFLSCAGAAMGKGSSGSSGGFSTSGSSSSYSSSSYSSSSYASSSYSSGKMTGSSWGANGRTSGGSRIYRHDDYYYSSGPRTYYGGTGHRGPRYYNNRVIATTTAAFAAVWAGRSYGRYSFYDREAFCSQEGYFRFGGNCKKCSTSVCPDGQYRVECGGGTDGYCTKCDNGCGLFNTDQAASRDSEPRFGVCLQNGSICYPYQSPNTCAYTSEGEPGKAVSNCQIESCCTDCTNDEDAFAQKKGTVCSGSTAGLANKDEKATLRFEGELPLTESEFNAAGSRIISAIKSVAGGAQPRSTWVTERDPADVTPYRLATSSASGSQLRSCLVGFEVDTTTRSFARTRMCETGRGKIGSVSDETPSLFSLFPLFSPSLPPTAETSTPCGAR